MSDLKMKVFLVNEIESEAGWGSRDSAQYVFPSEELALEFCEKYHAENNNLSYVPDTYYRQEYKGTVKITESQFNKHKYKGDLIVMPEWNFTGT